MGRSKTKRRGERRERGGTCASAAFWLKRSQSRVHPSTLGLRMSERFYGCDGSTHYEFEWEATGLKPKANANGISGFARVTNRSRGVGGLVTGYLGRVHRCAWNPCRAVYPANKYGTLGPPLHAQPTEWRPQGAPPPPAPPDSPLVEEPPAPPDLPGEPAKGALKPLTAALPLLPGSGAAVAAERRQKRSAEGVLLVQMVESSVLTKMLQLAREIRRPRAYIGYRVSLLRTCPQLPPMCLGGRPQG